MSKRSWSMGVAALVALGACSGGEPPEHEERAPDMRASAEDMALVPRDMAPGATDMAPEAQEMNDGGGDEQDMEPGPDMRAGAPDAGSLDMGDGLEPVPDPQSYADCAPYAPAGPYPVGVLTLEGAGGPVEVWYPAPDGAGQGQPREVYDLRDWLPAEEQDKVPEDAPTTFETGAFRGLEARQGRWPVVLFSHGFAGYRLQSTFLTTHLASWGFVVASAEHEERWLPTILEGDLGQLGMGDDAAVLSGALEALEAADADPNAALYERVDTQRVGLTGHSAGGRAILEVSGDERYGPLVALTPAVRSFDGSEAPAAQGSQLLISGSRDRLTRASDIEAYYAEQAAPRAYLRIEGAGHLAFTDICVIGRRRGGILQIAEDAGLEVPLTVKALARDGCQRSDLRAEIAWPVINHFTTARLRAELGVDAQPVGLGSEAAQCFGELVGRYERDPEAP